MTINRIDRTRNILRVGMAICAVAQLLPEPTGLVQVVAPIVKVSFMAADAGLMLLERYRRRE